MSFERKFQIRSRSTTAPNGLGLLRRHRGLHVPRCLDAPMRSCSHALQAIRPLRHPSKATRSPTHRHHRRLLLRRDQPQRRPVLRPRRAPRALRPRRGPRRERDGGGVRAGGRWACAGARGAALRAGGVGVAGEADAHRGHGEHGEPDGEHGAGGVRAVHAGHGGAHRAAGPEPEPVSARGACGAEGDGDDGDVLGDARARVDVPM
mmetsp:Transcript_51922/g.135515  ORF Transcript_51922/g.135515 Transcript_51922/m.135515 type:complete len:206 (-) Transcript_51922:1235-1852(-)